LYGKFRVKTWIFPISLYFGRGKSKKPEGIRACTSDSQTACSLEGAPGSIQEVQAVEGTGGEVGHQRRTTVEGQMMIYPHYKRKIFFLYQLDAMFE
jgi:hypothetical protein